MLLAIRFFEPLFGALIVVPFFGLPPWLLRFKLHPMRGEYAKRDQKWHSRPKNDGYAICTQEYILQNCRFFTALQDLAVKSYIA